MRDDRKNKALIGFFVLGALIILLLIILIIGSGSFYKKTTPFVLYFDNSLTGLGVGSPVQFQGVKIGQVTNVRVESNVDELQFKTPVFIEIDNTLFGDNYKHFMFDDIEYYEQLLQKGLCAKLSTLSLLTGQLSVDLEFIKNYSGNITVKFYDEETIIIPTLPSTFDELLNRFTALPIEEIALKTIQALDSINKFVNTDAAHMTKSFAGLADEISSLALDLQGQITGLTPLVEHANKIFVSTENNMKNVSDSIQTSLASLNKTLAELDGAIQSGTKLLDNSQKIVAEDSPVLIDLSRALSDISNAANAVKEFADVLSRDPNALIFGKGK